jgi:flagellar protein FlaG
MKIDGTEAISFNIPKIKSADIATSTGNTEVPATKEVKSKDTDFRNLSQISDFEKRELPISEKLVIDAIEKANRAISGANRRFEFSIHEKTKEIMVKVIDSDTNQVIREIPNEKILDMVSKMWEMAGLIVDERR